MRDIKLDVLCKNLIKDIQLLDDPFVTPIIVFPNFKVKDYFKAYYLKNNQSILMNIEYKTLNSVLYELFDTNLKLANKEIIKTLIIKLLKENKIELEPIAKNYLISDNSEKEGIKLYDLSSLLASLFIKYENNLTSIKGWQKELYDQLISELNNHGYTTLNNLYISNTKMKKTSSPLFVFGFPNFSPLQEAILNRINDDYIKVYSLESSKIKNLNYKVINAPSMIREIEYLHSDICTKILKEDANLSDFIVFAPKINEYANTIRRVFEQDDTSFPNIPYSINGVKSIETNVKIILEKLIEIQNKKYFSRDDVYQLLSNSLIRKNREIEYDDLEKYKKVIIDLNVYRELQDNKQYSNGVNRILLSKLVDINDTDNSIICLKDNDYTPFYSIGLDDNNIYTFTKFIKDLDRWIDVWNDIEKVNSTNIDLISLELEKWLSYKENNVETSYYLIKIKQFIDTYKMFDVDKIEIEKTTFFNLLLDCVDSISKTKGSIYSSGVSFIDFDKNTVLSSKYIYFIGMSSINFPVKETKNELDLDTNDDYLEITKNTFNAILNNTENTINFSYVCKDLKKDEELYLSNLVHEFEEKKIQHEVVNLSIDENRNFSQLFTKKEYKDKYFTFHPNNLETIKEEIVIEEDKEKEAISLSTISKFLEEPLSCKAKQLFGNEDENDEKIKESFEPFSLNALDSYSVINNIVISQLNNKNISKEDIKKRLKLSGLLQSSDELLSNKIFDDLFTTSEEVTNNIRSCSNNNYRIDNIDRIDFDNFILTNNKEIIYCINDNVEYYQAKKLKDDDKLSYFINLYVTSLFHISSLQIEDILNVKLVIRDDITRSYKINSKAAIKMINEIYAFLKSDNSNFAFSCDWLESKDDPESLLDLANLLYSERGAWKYFEYKNMFNKHKQLGYDSENFNNDYLVKKRLISKYVLIADLEKGGDNNE